MKKTAVARIAAVAFSALLFAGAVSAGVGEGASAGEARTVTALTVPPIDWP